MRKRIACLLVSALAVCGLAGCGSASTNQLRFGTAGTGGTYYAVGTSLSDMLRDDKTTFDVKTTAGSSANLRLLSNNFLHLALAQSDIIEAAAAGGEPFDEPLAGYSAVASLYTEPCQIVVRADSNISTVADLQGKIVSVGEVDSGVTNNARQILLTYGLSFDLVDTRTLSFADAAAALADGEIDAFFCTAGAPTNAVANLARHTPIRLLELGEAETARLVATYGCYTACIVPAGTYDGQTEDVKTIGVRAVLLASDKLDTATVYRLTDGLFAHAQQLQMSTPADTPIIEGDAAEGVTIPFHAGAVQYYTEHGISVEAEG